jgi:hypothetical protein
VRPHSGSRSNALTLRRRSGTRQYPSSTVCHCGSAAARTFTMNELASARFAISRRGRASSCASSSARIACRHCRSVRRCALRAHLCPQAGERKRHRASREVPASDAERVRHNANWRRGRSRCGSVAKVGGGGGAHIETGGRYVVRDKHDLRVGAVLRLPSRRARLLCQAWHSMQQAWPDPTELTVRTAEPDRCANMPGAHQYAQMHHDCTVDRTVDRTAYGQSESKHAALPINALCLATSCAAIQRSTDQCRADSVVLFGKLCCAACREAGKAQRAALAKGGPPRRTPDSIFRSQSRAPALLRRSRYCGTVEDSA